MDFPYNRTDEPWDQRTFTQNDFNEAVTSMNMINSNPNTYCFAWCDFLQIHMVYQAILSIGWPKSGIKKWTAINAYALPKAGSDVVYGTEEVHLRFV